MTSEEILKIEGLHPNMRDLNFNAKIVELSEKRTVLDRRSGSENQVMDVIIGDETGLVVFSAWNETIDKVEVGKNFVFENSKTILFRGHLRVSLGRQGSISEIEEDIENVNSEINMSDKEHANMSRNRRGGGYRDDQRRDNWKKY